MSKLTQKNYQTKLETADASNIVAILDAKLEATSPQSVTDYIGLAIDNLDDAILRMKDAKKELDILIKNNELQKDIIKAGGAIWLSGAGIDKLPGDIVSSVSIYTPKPKESLKVLNEEALINQGYFKTVVDKTAVKDAIKNDIKIDGAEIEIIHDAETLKINKRRK